LKEGTSTYQLIQVIVVTQHEALGGLARRVLGLAADSALLTSGRGVRSFLQRIFVVNPPEADGWMIVVWRIVSSTAGWRCWKIHAVGDVGRSTESRSMRPTPFHRTNHTSSGDADMGETKQPWNLTSMIMPMSSFLIGIADRPALVQPVLMKSKTP